MRNGGNENLLSQLRILNPEIGAKKSDHTISC
jgi:hypothetical protein